MKLTKDNFSDNTPYIIACDNELRDQILKNQKIVEQLEHRKKHPQAFNYAQFEVWVTDILNGGDGFPLPKELIDETN